MKNLLYIILIILFRGIAIFAQPSGTINTPKGNTIEYFIYSLGDTAFYRAQAESLISDNNWDATIDAPASGRYNCHSYAWYVAENGAEYWINAWDYNEYDPYDASVTPTNTPTNLIEYWSNDGGYHNISKVAKAKVYYGSQWVWKYTLYGYRWVNEKDHSAIVDSNTDYFISKWGSLPRYKHKPSHCPYASSSLSYFKLDAPSISGITSTLICNNLQRTFTSDITEPNFIYNWNITSPLTEVSGDGTTAYTIASGSQNGLSTLSLSITTPSGVIVSTNRNIWAGKPVISSISGPLSTPNYQWATYHANLQSTLSAPTDYTWILNPLNGNSVYDYGMSCDIAFYNTGSYQLVAQAQNVCGTGPYYVTGVYVYDTYSLMISPNPSTDETVISIESTSKEKTFDADAEWEYEVYTDKQLLMQKQTSVKGTSSTINTTGWKDGVYFIRVIYKNEVLQGKLVVKH